MNFNKKYWLLGGILILLAIGFGCAQGKKNNKPNINRITASKIKMLPGDIVTLAVDASDEDDDTLDFKWTISGGSLSNDSGTTVYWTAPENYGYYHIYVEVDDGESEAHGSITLQVTESPRITNIAYNSPVDPTGLVYLTATFSPDPAADDLTITWRSSPSGGTFNTTSGESVEWTAPANPAGDGKYNITVSVGDGVTPEPDDSLTIEVQVNVPTPKRRLKAK